MKSNPFKKKKKNGQKAEQIHLAPHLTTQTRTKKLFPSWVKGQTLAAMKNKFSPKTTKEAVRGRKAILVNLLATRPGF